jgi:hypothetical protein
VARGLGGFGDSRESLVVGMIMRFKLSCGSPRTRYTEARLGHAGSHTEVMDVNVNPGGTVTGGDRRHFTPCLLRVW